MEQSLKILIADENTEFRDRAKEELKKQGFKFARIDEMQNIKMGENRHIYWVLGNFSRGF